MQRQLSVLVVGLAHPNSNGSNRKFEALTCAPGDRVHLVREPKNKADPHAVAVYSPRGVQLGYVTAERAPWIGALIGRGEEVSAIFQSLGSTTAVIRVAIGGGEPVLPAPTSSAEPSAPSVQLEEQDWYPDFIPPDDAYL
jgi:hypothetical protein